MLEQYHNVCGNSAFLFLSKMLVGGRTGSSSFQNPHWLFYHEFTARESQGRHDCQGKYNHRWTGVQGINLGQVWSACHELWDSSNQNAISRFAMIAISWSTLSCALAAVRKQCRPVPNLRPRYKRLCGSIVTTPSPPTLDLVYKISGGIPRLWISKHFDSMG